MQVIERPLIEEAALGTFLARRFTLVTAAADVAVLDRNSLPGETGAMVRQLRSDGARVLVLSSSSDRPLVDLALRAGAEGFLTRLKDWRDLEAAVCALAEGRNMYGPEVAAAFADPALALDIIDGPAWDLEPVRSDAGGRGQSEALTLSPREAQILQLVATGQSNSVIALSLNISTHTVRKHRENLMVKLKLHNIAEVTAFAVRSNLIATAGRRVVN